MSSKGFLMYNDRKKSIERLSDENAGKLLKKIFAYQSDEIYDGGEITEAIFGMIESTFQRDKEKYETVKKTRSELGKLGVQAKAKKAKQKLAIAEKKKAIAKSEQANQAVSVSVSDSVSVREKENISGTNVPEEQSSQGEKKSYGDTEINEVFEIVKEFNDGITDDKKDGKSRGVGKHFINKLKDLNKVKDGGYTWQEYLRALLMIVSRNQYHRHKISGVGNIYNHLAELIQIANAEHKNQSSKTVKSF